MIGSFEAQIETAQSHSSNARSKWREETAALRMAFDAVLDAARSATVTMPAAPGGISENLMFEAQRGSNEAKRTARRQTASTTDGQGMVEKGRDVSGRTAVSQAGRIAVDTRTAGHGEQLKNSMPQFLQTKEISGFGTGGRSFSESAMDRPIAFAQTTIEGGQVGEAKALSGQGFSVNVPNGGEAVQGVGHPQQIAGANHTVRVSSDSPAKQVAQILSTAKGGEVQSVRAVAPAGDADPGRNIPRDVKQTEKQTPPRPDSGVPRQSTAASTAEPAPFDKLIRSIRLQQSERISTARMQLQPEELGRMDVRVRLESGELTIDVRTETTKAKQLMMERVAELKQAFAQHGLRVDRFEVTTDLQNEQGERNPFDSTGQMGTGDHADSADHDPLDPDSYDEYTVREAREWEEANDDSLGAGMARNDSNESSQRRVVAEARLDVTI